MGLGLRTVKFFFNHNIFSDFQFGFREKHSTIHAILTFIHKAATAIDNHYHTTVEPRYKEVGYNKTLL